MSDLDLKSIIAKYAAHENEDANRWNTKLHALIEALTNSIGDKKFRDSLKDYLNSSSDIPEEVKRDIREKYF